MLRQSHITPFMRWGFNIVWLALLAATCLVLASLLPGQIAGAESHWEVAQTYAAVSTWLPLGVFARYALALRYVSAGLHIAIGVLIFVRKRDDPLARWASLSLILAAVALNQVGYVDTTVGSPLPWPRGFVPIYTALRSFGTFTYVALFYIFPTGRISNTPPRWLQLSLLALTLLSALTALIPEGITSHLLDDPYPAMLATLIATLCCGCVSLAFRYRGMDEAQRSQTKWVVAGLIGTALVKLLGIIPSLALGDSPAPVTHLLVFHANLLSDLFVPAAFGVALLRHRLFDVDRLLRRTAVYGALTLAIAVVYALVIIGAGMFFQQSADPAFGIIAACAAALIAQPVRERTQHAVNQLLFGQRNDPATLLAELGAAMQAGGDMAGTLRKLELTLAQSLRLGSVTILPTYGFGARATGGSQAHAGVAAFPLRHQGLLVGTLLARPRIAGEILSRDDVRCIQTVARQIEPALRAEMLTHELRQSRERIVMAREAERARIRRDLHDELGPTLAAQTLQLDAALEALTNNPIRARTILDFLKQQTQTTVADVRLLVDGLRPAALDELGLPEALRNLGHSLAPQQFDVTIHEPLPTLTPASEVAAFRIAAEAMTNIAKHARATIGRVDVRAEDGRLRIRAADDGCGGIAQSSTTGVGLRSMRERAEELGGNISIESTPGLGTVITAELPL